MGATSWRYYAPYVSDPEVALQTLRAEVFARGEYQDPTRDWDQVLRDTFVRCGGGAGAPLDDAQLEEALRLPKAIQSGDTKGLGRAEKAVVERVRAAQALAALLGAQTPTLNDEPPDTIEELLELAAESGTHSILDIERTAPRRGFGIAVPMSSSALVRKFGTQTPSHEQAEQHWADVAEELDRWNAVSAVIFLAGEPREYVFIGCSGD